MHPFNFCLSIATLAVLVLALVGKLGPRMPYLIAAAYYLLDLLSNLIVAIVVAVQVGGELPDGDHAIEEFLSNTPWIAPVDWVLNGLFFGVGVYTLIRVFRESPATAESSTRAR